MPLHPRLHMFPLIVECTANQALNTLCHFLDSAAFAATPAETPASETILELSGAVTVMSKAAVSLTLLLDTRISAGLVLSSLLPKPHPASRQAGIEVR